MTSRLAAPASMTPVAGPRILFLLYSILLCAIADLSLSLINLGLTSFFLGLITASAAIIHTLTNLFIIFYRRRWERGQESKSRLQGRSLPPISSQHTSAAWDWNLIPPTSKLSSITMDLLLAAMFVVSSATTLFLHFTHYFGGDSSWFGQSTGSLKGPKVVYADAAMELLCGILLFVLGIIGLFERRKFREMEEKVLSQTSGIEA